VTALHLYALVVAPPGDGSLPVELAGRLRCCTAHGLTVVFEPVTAAPPRGAAELRAHDGVVRHLAVAFPAVLPFRFGQLVASEEALAGALERRRALLQRRLERVRGCLQWTVRVYGPPEETEALGGAGPGTRYLAARRHHADAVRSVRARLVVGAREEIVAPGRPPLLASLYYLVHGTDHAAFRQCVAKTREDGELRCSVSGPWPPYAFAGEIA
jgi:hypothetical protein